MVGPWFLSRTYGRKASEKFDSLDLAKKFFEAKFHQKTMNAWAVRKREFHSIRGKYDMVSP